MYASLIILVNVVPVHVFFCFVCLFVLSVAHVTETFIAYNLEYFLSKACSTLNSETVLIASASHNYRESQ